MMDPSDAITRGYGIGQGHLVAGSVLRHALGLPHHALASFRTSVTRLTNGGSVLGEEQRLGQRAAPHALTSDSAYLTHDDGHPGMLAADMNADLTVLDQDIAAGCHD